MTPSTYNLLLTPDEHQWVGIQRIEESKHFIIGDDMGVGKTLQAMAITAKYRLRTLVICPAIAKSNWVKEFKKALNYQHKSVVDKFDPSADIIITNYERISNLEEAFVWAECVIFDEAQYLKTVDSGRSSLAQWYISERADLEYLILLTGTPMKNRAHEFYPLLRLVSMHTDAQFMKTYKNIRAFMTQFCLMETKKIRTKRRTIYKPVVKGTKNLDLLAAIIKRKLIRRDKSVLKLKEPRSIYFRVEDFSDGDLKAAWDGYSEGKAKGAGSSAKRLSATAKAPLTAEYVADLVNGGHGPIVVFSDHVDSAKIVSENCTRKGLRSGVIGGWVPDKVRDSLIEKFQAGELDVLAATIGTMSTAITLTKSHQIVFNDLAWVPSDNAQAVGRVLRRGQLHSCMIHYMVGSEVDESISKTLSSKVKDINAVYNSIQEDNRGRGSSGV